MKTTIKSIHKSSQTKIIQCPIPLEKIPAGFPNEISDYIEGYLDLNKHLIKNPISTFFLRVAGTSMTKAGIFPDDILIVDKSLQVQNGNVVVAIINNEFLVKRYKTFQGDTFLVDETDKPETKYYDFEIWGVVTSSIHTL